MFDLNLSMDFSGNDKFEANNSGFQSPDTSLASAENGERGSSSSNDERCSRRAADGSGWAASLKFNLDLPNTDGNYRIERDDIDQGLTSSESGLVTRELFPISLLNDTNRGWRRHNEPADPLLVHGPHQHSLPLVAAAQHPLQQVQQGQARKSRRGPRSRSSQYRGVTFYRRTGRWESHIWDCGKQVYLGGFDTALAAARVYDRAAIRFRGVDADINFNLSDYDDVKEMMNLSKEEFVHVIRQRITGFSRGSSRYRGVTLHKCGRWEARMGQFLGKNDYEKSAVLCNENDAVTNFESSTYNRVVMSEPCNEGSQHDLDLNLGISGSSPKESELLGSLQLHLNVQNTRTLKLHIGKSDITGLGNPPIKGVPVVTSERPILCTGVNPKFVPIYEERVSDQRTSFVSQQKLENWTWQMHQTDSQARLTTNTTSATAASSGFSSLAGYNCFL